MRATDARIVKARKAHVCVLCGDAIDKDSAYKRWVCFDSDGVFTVKVHPDCDSEARQYDWYFGEWAWDYPLREERQEQAYDAAQVRTGETAHKGWS